MPIEPKVVTNQYDACPGGARSGGVACAVGGGQGQQFPATNLVVLIMQLVACL
jgi:hypothetical protein